MLHRECNRDEWERVLVTKEGRGVRLSGGAATMLQAAGLGSTGVGDEKHIRRNGTMKIPAESAWQVPQW